MDKEVITRTSGKKLGYVNQLYVDPARLEVVSVYLRQNATSFGASNTDHVLLSSLRQIGDVVLVHDESALLDPPADETYGYIRVVGTEVETEDGTSLGKVRDYVFNPDNGQIVSIRYDALGIPSIPQSLLSCYSLDWRDVLAVGPLKTVVRRGAERRSIKENDGWISEYVSALVNAVAGNEQEVYGTGEDTYRSDPAYAAWYAQHAAEYERYYNQVLPKPLQSVYSQPQSPQEQPARRRPAAAPRPNALPPPRSVPYNQAIQSQDARKRIPTGQQAAPMRSGPRERVAVGAGSTSAQPRMQQRRPVAPFPGRPREGVPPFSEQTPSRKAAGMQPGGRNESSKATIVQPDAVIRPASEQRPLQRGGANTEKRQSELIQEP
jgi:sporulation protein YlmC with PRC-barrel domain